MTTIAPTQKFGSNDTNPKRLIRFGLLAVFALAAVFAASPIHAGSKDKGKHIDRMVAHMEKELTLSKDQSTKIRAILSKDTAELSHHGMGKKGHGCKGCESCSKGHGKGGHGMGMMGGGEFAAQMRAANVDTGALNKQFEERQSKMREMHAKHVARFTEIHAVLTPEQRAKAATNMEKRSAKMEKRCKK